MLLPPTSGNSAFFGRLASSNVPMPDPEPVEANDSPRSSGEKSNVSGARAPSSRPPPPTSSMLRKIPQAVEKPDVDSGKGANSVESAVPVREAKRSWKNSSVNSQFQSQQSANKPKAINSRMSMLPPRRPPPKKKITKANNVEPAKAVDNNIDLEEDVLSAVASILSGDFETSMPSAAPPVDPKEDARIVPRARQNPPASNPLPVASTDNEYARPNNRQMRNVGRINPKETQQLSDGVSPKPQRSPFRGLPIQTGQPDEPFLDLALEELLAGELSNASLSLPNSPVYPVEESVPTFEAADPQYQLTDEEESARLSQMNGWDDPLITETEDEGDEDQAQNLSNNGWGSPVESLSEENEFPQFIMDEGEIEEGTFQETFSPVEISSEENENPQFIRGEKEIKAETFQETLDKLEMKDNQDNEQEVDVDDFMAFLASVVSDLEASKDDVISVNETLSTDEAVVTPDNRSTISSVASGPIVLAMAIEDPSESNADEEPGMIRFTPGEELLIQRQSPHDDEEPDMLRFTPGEELIQTQSPPDQDQPHSPVVLKSLGKNAPKLTPLDVPVLSSPKPRSASLKLNAPQVAALETRQRSSTLSTPSDIKPATIKTPKRVSSINFASTHMSALAQTPTRPPPAKSIQSNVNRVAATPEQPTPQSPTVILKSLPSLPSLDEQISSNLKSSESDAVADDLYTLPSEPRQSVLASQSFLDKFNLLMGDNSPAFNIGSSESTNSNRDMESMI